MFHTAALLVIPWLAPSLAFTAQVAPQEAPPKDAAPRRIRLFDRMDQAEVSGGVAPSEESQASPPPPPIVRLEFAGPAKRRLWLGHPAGWRVQWSAATAPLVASMSEGGVDGGGGALRLGPDLSDDRAFVSFVVPARPLTRYVLRGRVKLVGHPSPDAASSREVVQILQHEGDVSDPTAIDDDDILDFQQVGREIDASGWDRFEHEIPLTRAETGSLEIRLLHRSGDADTAETWFDDLELAEMPMSEADIWRLLLERYRPQDGLAEATPWRLRVTLPSRHRVKEVTNDATLLPPARSLSIPVTLPPADAAPILRFACGMLPEGFLQPGAAARIDVTFTPASSARPAGSVPVAIGSVEFDPRNEESQRCWHSARMDLAPVAGQSGRLTFTAGTSSTDARAPLDAIVLATPRIEPADEAPKGMNVLLIASDTLRADRLSAFGYGRPTSPNLEQLARHAVRFTKTRSQAPWTLPSFSSIMTSLYPSEHGAGRGGRDEWTPLDPGVTTLADVLARVGYETVAISANHLVSPEYGLDQGFESFASTGEYEWRTLGLESVKLDAPLVVKFLEEHQSAPFFLFWHMMDPHLPYTTAAAQREPFTDPEYGGRFQGESPIVPFRVLDPRPGRRWFTHEGPPKPPPLTDADKQFVSDYYDAEIKEIDDAIGRVLDTLRRTGMWERTIVVMTADHGEGLGEHGHYHHGYTLFEEQLHIPFILRVPGAVEGGARNEPVASIDIAPTILAALGMTPPPSFSGESRLAAPEATSRSPIFLEYPSYDSSAEKGVILGDWKYLHDPWFHTEALYDTVRDPLERDDVKAAHPELVAEGRALLDEFRWQYMQKGRFHVRVHGRTGAKLRVAVAIDDLLDANFATRPLLDEHDFKLDLERKQLVLETTMASEKLELVCWGRGGHLVFEVTLDGQPIEGGIRVGSEPAARTSPCALARSDLPRLAGAELLPPAPLQALIWLELGAGDVKAIVPSPADAEMLRQLGYAH